MNLLQTRYEIAVWLKKVTEYFDSGTTMFLAISKAFLPQSRPNSPDRALTPTLSREQRGEGAGSVCCTGTRSSLLTSPRSFAGRGRNSRDAGISGEGHGTVSLRIQCSRIEPPTPTPSPPRAGGGSGRGVLPARARLSPHLSPLFGGERSKFARRGNFG